MTREEASIKGGQACFEKHGKEHYRSLGRKSAESRVRKLSVADVAYAASRFRRGETIQSIAKSFGVSKTTLRRDLGR